MAARTLSLTALAEVPLVAPGDDLAGLIEAALEKNRISLEDGDILVLAQKIVSKAEDCYRDLATVDSAEHLLRCVLVIAGEMG